MTIKGEKIANEKSEKIEFNNFDVVISSNYVRTILTAKHFTRDNILVDENFGERKFGINNWSKLPINFEERQFRNFDYKLPNGESLNEVIDREYDSLINILNTYVNKKVLIVGHSTALACLFSKWCDIDDTGYRFRSSNKSN